MRKYFLLLLLLISITISAQNLFYIEKDRKIEIETYFKTKNFDINYYNDHFMIASSNSRQISYNHSIIEEDSWSENYSYFLVWKNNNDSEYVNFINEVAKILLQREKFLIIKIKNNKIEKLYPTVHGGLVKINNKKAKLPKNKLLNKVFYEEDPFINQLLAEVNPTTLENTVQHLEDYGTREWNSAESVDAQNWLKGQYESFGLTTAIVDIPSGSNSSSDNVIAMLEGTKYPDEYVMIGGHYDSISNGSDAPGADDNASGTAGVLECARIMSQYDFDRSIVFCSFSGEEYGLYGSAAYVNTFSEDMEVLGYFNIDMAGYLHPGNEIMTTIIAPSTAQPLIDFYSEISNIYLPNFQIEQGFLSGGDSDHTSFNNKGIMGIFPFEDADNYSPYIHTPDDLIGASVNSFEMMATFTKATLASAGTLANLILPPQNLTAMPGDSQVELNWYEMEDINYYKIYRNNSETAIDTSYTNNYIDLNVENGNEYSYYVTAILSDSDEETSASSTVYATPMPLLTLPYENDFENNTPYWTLENDWNSTNSNSHSGDFSLTDSPAGNYSDNANYSATLRNFSSVAIDNPEINYWVKYDIENNYDYVYFEISTDNVNWDILKTYTGNQNTWTLESISLLDFINEDFIKLRFRLTSDGYINKNGIYIDDFTISGENVSSDDITNINESEILNYPNPFYLNNSREQFNKISFNLKTEQDVKIEVFNLKGQRVKTIIDKRLDQGSHLIRWNGKNTVEKLVSSGIYTYKITIGSKTNYSKCLLIK